ncbi:hypothetical protein [Inhella proteolytica]|uniref:DUF5667 domain-containing protein n=1 Tax=Inhella proteolytica TaxID=2795029 RepID=A0A931J6I3_9BURK|nr:hypothetical protein [Inhella proteolytica]MBH9577222.1 hypothetical protein [Inhella proteolytica]
MLAVMRLLIWAMLLWTVPLAVAGAAPDKALESGTYIRTGDTGTLTLRRARTGALEFELDTLGANAHECSAAGQVSGRIATTLALSDERPNEVCRLDFQIQGPHIRVRVLTSDNCSRHCGARAAFEGDYSKPPANCTTTAVAQRRAQFLKQYHAKQHALAAQSAEALLKDCSDFLFWFTQDSIRSDLALAQLRAGQPKACLATLEQTAAGKVADQEGLRAALPPVEYDSYEWANAIWHNRRLCQQAISSSVVRQDQGRNGPGAARP